MTYEDRPFVLQTRSAVFVWDDPQRRCYDGAFGAHHYEWGAWETLDRLETAEKAAAKLKFWSELNDYAVTSRGESARREFKVLAELYAHLDDNHIDTALRSFVKPLEKPQ